MVRLTHLELRLNNFINEFKGVLWNNNKIIKTQVMKPFICQFFNLKNTITPQKLRVLRFVSRKLMLTWLNDFDQTFFKYALKSNFFQKLCFEINQLWVAKAKEIEPRKILKEAFKGLSYYYNLVRDNKLDILFSLDYLGKKSNTFISYHSSICLGFTKLLSLWSQQKTLKNDWLKKTVESII